MNNTLKNTIIDAYGFSNEKSIHFFNNVNNRILSIKYNDETYLLKKHSMLDQTAVHTLEQLFDEFQKFYITAPMMKTVNNTYIICIDGSYYSLLKKLNTNNINIKSHLKKIAQKIAMMHMVMDKVKNKTLKSPLFVSTEKNISLLENYNLSYLIPIITNDVFNPICFQLVHNDLHIGNVIATNSDNIYIIDFDCLSYNSLIADIVFAAFRLTGGFQTPFINFLKYYDEISPINRSEIQFGYLFLLKDFTRKLCFILKEHERGNFFYYNKDLKKYLNFIRETKIMNEKGKLNF